jgi:hypothetical protein
MGKYFLQNGVMKPVATRDMPIGSQAPNWRKEVLVRWNQLRQYTYEKLGLTWFRRKLIKIYFSLPTRFQYRLARFGLKAVVRKKKAEWQEMLPH